MKIKCFVNGFLDENCYLVYNNENALIIDPGSEIKEMEEFIRKNNLKVDAILITHYHFDHIDGLEYYKKLYNVNVIDFENNFKTNFYFEIINFFGHTLDSCAFYFKEEKIMFTGDFLFKETIGNFKEGNKKIMQSSIEKIKTYDKNIKIYPGHGLSTSIEHELNNNIYLKGEL